MSSLRLLVTLVYTTGLTSPACSDLNDAYYIARAIHGEGAQLFGEQRDTVGMWIAHTLLNRTTKPWWTKDQTKSPIVEVTMRDFHGYVNSKRPPLWACRIALQAIRRDRDMANGALFMLSGKDLAAMRVSHVRRKAIKEFRGPDGDTFYFFDYDWPWKVKKEP